MLCTAARTHQCMAGNSLACCLNANRTYAKLLTRAEQYLAIYGKMRPEASTTPLVKFTYGHVKEGMSSAIVTNTRDARLWGDSGCAQPSLVK